MFKEIGVQHLLQDIFTQNYKVENTISKIKSLLIENFEYRFMESLITMPILRTYCTFKKIYGRELYLKHIINFSLRSSLSKFRLSSHSLEIERGRHCKPKVPAEKRICKLYVNKEVLRMKFTCYYTVVPILMKGLFYFNYVISQMIPHQISYGRNFFIMKRMYFISQYSSKNVLQKEKTYCQMVTHDYSVSCLCVFYSVTFKKLNL